jgi:very-short-patch-repair endonuclease
MVEYQCDYCGKISSKRKSYIKPHNFCNAECYHKYQSEFIRGENNKNSKPKNKYYCVNCNKEIEKLECQIKNNKNIFCSKKCRLEYDSKTFKGKGNPNYKGGDILFNCLYCKNEFYRPLHQKNRAKFCCKKCKDKYWSEVLSKTPENQKRLRQQGINAMLSQKNKFTKPEMIVNEYLKQYNIECFPQHPMFNRFVVDFFIPSLNIVIEVLGDYWHGNPLKYIDDKLTEKQLKSREKDKFKNEYLTEKGYEVHMIWENDIYKQLDKTMEFLNI